MLSLSVGRFRGRYADKPLPFADQLGRRFTAALTGTHHYEPVPVDDLTADGIGRTVRRTPREAAAAGSNAVVVVHGVGHGEPHPGQLPMVGSDGVTDQDTTIGGWMS